MIRYILYSIVIALVSIALIAAVVVTATYLYDRETANLKAYYIDRPLQLEQERTQANQERSEMTGTERIPRPMRI